MHGGIEQHLHQLCCTGMGGGADMLVVASQAVAFAHFETQTTQMADHKVKACPLSVIGQT